jgi:hypothetical protein
MCGCKCASLTKLIIHEHVHVEILLERHQCKPGGFFRPFL